MISYFKSTLPSIPVFCFFVLWSLLLFTSGKASAQDILAQPICTKLINEADYRVRGSISTARSTYSGSGDEARDGTQARHVANFALGPDEQMDVCSSGPFYDGQRLELVLRTLIPVFTCQTSLILPIRIKGERDSDGILRTYAECY